MGAQSADEFIERAIQMLHEQEDWLARNRDEIAGQIEHGFAQAEQLTAKPPIRQ